MADYLGSMPMIAAKMKAPTHGKLMPLPAALAKAAELAPSTWSFGVPAALACDLVMGIACEASISSG